MNKFNLISLIALLALVVVLPFYAVQEFTRMEVAQDVVRQQYLNNGVVTYIQSCAECHDIDGSGVGANPALNRAGLAGADPQSLFMIISRAAHGTAMAAWHEDAGGILTDLQIEELVSVIRFADWSQVDQIARDQGVDPTELATFELSEVYIQALDVEDPHQCVACHEDPEVHADRFGLDCVRCHTLEAWLPAFLTRHTFELDHGGEDELACETCHLDNYVEHSCYECHDHQPDDMAEVHEAEQIFEYSDCIRCHPTGVSGEAEQWMQYLDAAEGY